MLTIALVAISLFTGCRAFQPEAVVVNRAPETFLIGAPLEGGGGYYHYHMFWYGSDEDGVVEKFVWAVTDTSVQNEDTADDEEDARFNPALDITHLEFANWTTKTDSIFDFQINQGTAPSADMTFHMVAMDDFGDFDRTPARLYFFSNTLGSPVINFFRINETDTIPLAVGEPDTVGFRKPYHLYWEGMSPNVLGYDTEALAAVDTVFPFDDGLYGYKWQLAGELGGFCVPAFEDCWHPRLFNESTNDSFSYFAEINSLLFRNNGNSSSDPFSMELESGEVNVRINSLDVAGVEVANHLRDFNFVVNHDPETIILVGRDTFHTSGANPDTSTYPYYTLLNDPERNHYPFQEGARIPDRSYVVFKALARDNINDSVVDPDFQIGMTGVINGLRENYTGGPFSFSSGASDINYEPEWDQEEEGGWYADTLGFMVGPSTEFTFTMQAVDEHGRRDGSPAHFSFEVGFPPCVQCIELQPDLGSVSAYPMDLDCHDPEIAGHPCFGGDYDFYIPKSYLPEQPGRTYLDPQIALSTYLVISKSTMTPVFQLEEADPDLNFIFPCTAFSMTVKLHGIDDPREAWSDQLNRARAWKYQVDYECDPANKILDGGGSDDIGTPTWGYEYGTPGISVSEIDGLWDLNVNFFLPDRLLLQGIVGFWNYIFYVEAGNDAALTDELVAICLRQMSAGSVRAIALDQADCDLQPVRPAKYHVFDTVRPPESMMGSETWRDCSPNYPTAVSLSLRHGTMDSAKYDENGVLITSEQFFNIYFEDESGDVQCGWSMPTPR